MVQQHNSVLFGEYLVPANVSRIHGSVDDAQRGGYGRIAFEITAQTGTLSNQLFDESLVQYDHLYCTTVVDIDGQSVVPTLDYIEDVLNEFVNTPNVIDIGCGQGEFVNALRNKGINCVGFDPVLRQTNAYLHDRYWSKEDSPADLYVMRCVLPHIVNPWQFLSDIWEAAPDAYVLVEYQRLEWMNEYSVWYQLCHDHIHQFVIEDFKSRRMLKTFGNFAQEEWQWVLLKRPSTIQTIEPHHFDERAEILSNLRTARFGTIAKAAQLIREGVELIVWGAAAKGAILSDTLLRSNPGKIRVVDMDKNRQGSYLEGSGQLVESPDTLRTEISGAVVLVANPRHVLDIHEYCGSRNTVLTPQQLLSY